MSQESIKPCRGFAKTQFLYLLNLLPTDSTWFSFIYIVEVIWQYEVEKVA